MLVVHRHRYDAQVPIDLTEWVTALDITLSTAEPWTSINASMKLPFSERAVAPEPGEWLTVHREDQGGRAIAWGNVTEGPEPGLVREDKRLHGGATLTQAWGWLNVLKMAQVYAHGSPGIKTSVGTMFNLDDWSLRATEILNTTSGAHGEQLTKLVRLLARLELPQTLGGGRLGDGVAVAHDHVTSERLGLYPQIDRVVGPRLSGDQAWPTSTNVLSMLMGIFRPNLELIELFETLCPLDQRRGGNYEQIISETRELERQRIETEADLGSRRASLVTSQSSEDNERLADVDYLGPARAIVGDAALVGKLRAVPALVYRIAPWRVESVDGYVKSVRQFERARELARELFPSGRTWPSTPDYAISAEECLRLDPPTRSNKHRVNAVTVDPVVGSAAIKFWEEAGLPLRDERDVARQGMRLLDVRWPFFAPHDTDLIHYLQLIAALGSQLFLRRERFLNGRLQVALRLDIQPGRVFQLNLPNGRKLTGYVETVRHNLTRNGRVLSGWTYITYSRGLYDEAERAVRATPSAPEPSTEVERPAKKPTAPLSRAGSWSAERRSSSRAGSTEACAAGAGIASWPSTLDAVDFLKVPSGLQRWAQRRGFNVSQDTPDNSKRKLVAMACGYVIERYWRQHDPSAELRFVSTSAHGGAHNLGAAFDFAVSISQIMTFAHTRVPVFQSWGALARLAAAGRIPWGGRGLYVNISRTGVRNGRIADQDSPAANPTAPSQAGSASPSSRSGVFPPGASGATHYDFRGVLGVTQLPGSEIIWGPRGTSWLWVDTNGDGLDDFKLGESGAGGGLAVYDQVHPDIKDYFLRNGRGERAVGVSRDPALDTVPVGRGVPNVMQVLGQVDSCFLAELADEVG